MEIYSPFPRLILPRLQEALADTPVVLIHGPRQCGKSTLARMFGETHGFRYLTFDDENVLAAAASDPVGFCKDLPERTILDEVQRVPGLFRSIKEIVDTDRHPGRLILTGSANVLLLPGLSDSLAGRMEVLRLGPLTQAEITRLTSPPLFLDAIFGASPHPQHLKRQGDELIRRVVTGGFPPVVLRSSERRRRVWLEQYSEALVQKDVRDFTRIRSLDVLPRLLEVAAAHTAELFVSTDLAAPFELSRPTIREYVTVLEALFLLELLPPWHSNRLTRMIKTPKLHMVDTGLASALLSVNPDSLRKDRPLFGHLLESFVFQELRRLASFSEHRHRFHHFRDKEKKEVDVVIERPGAFVAGVEVKASSTVLQKDFHGLIKLRDAMGERFVQGVVLYDGENVLPFGDRLYAVPVASLWS
ncbi:MAG: ATP-binding protein [Bacteroidetes bacterium]|nr:ATP-binding protein [Bacteroidota bacterium]